MTSRTTRHRDARPRVRLSLASALAAGSALCAPAAFAQETPRPAESGTVLAGHAEWAGPYLGIGGSPGGSFGRYRVGPSSIGGGTGSVGSGFGASGDGTSALAGGVAGYNWQSGPAVFGLEGTLAFAPLKRGIGGDTPGLSPGGTLDPGSDAVRIRRDTLGAVRSRLGFAVDDYLLYGSVGIAGARETVTSPLLPGVSRRAGDDLGFAYGFGIEAALSPQWSIGVDYQRSRFDAGRFESDLLPGLPRAKVTTDDVWARLTWHPDGLKLAPDVEEKPGDQQDWSLHGQTTMIAQATPRFRSPYTGAFSFLPDQGRETWTATGYLGRRLWDGAELYFNPELNQGFGLSRTLGIAGYVNGEAQKAGAPYPKYRSQRYFIRQVIGLGGETEDVPDGLNQIAGTRDIDRITITIGKFAVGDFFDDNAYSHDPRLNFNNWALWSSAAYDFPANLPGFTQGAVVELNRKEWALRAGFFQVPKDPNNDVLDPRVDRRYGAVVELEERFDIGGQGGKLRLGAFTNRGRTANYEGALDYAALTGTDPNDAAFQTRRGRQKSGVYGNLEQAITADLGMFVRASWNDGRNQTLSFTDIDRSVSGGLALKGTEWGREKDTVGIGGSANFLSAPHREFLAAGGLGLLIGDGRLTYSPEHALETYYKWSLASAVDLTFDYQLVLNPGYNADRGPANVFGVRLHAEF